MRLFFYGTLLDPDVQVLVLGRVLEPRELRPARLRHFRRVYIAGRAYPMILPHRGGTVDGALAEHLSRDDLGRITLYEGGGVSPRTAFGNSRRSGTVFCTRAHVRLALSQPSEHAAEHA